MTDKIIVIKRSYLMNKKLISLGILLFGLYISSNAANIALVPQTGQTATLPVTAPAGSDGALQKGKAWPNPRFVADASGNCITDNLTGLMWVKDLSTVNNGSPLTWDNALAVAGSGTWCGYSDWRMPNINELRSLVNYAYASPANWLMYGSGDYYTRACSGACFAYVPAVGWTSSSLANDTTFAWVVIMSNGGAGNRGKNSNYNIYLFPVRGGR